MTILFQGASIYATSYVEIVPFGVHDPQTAGDIMNNTERISGGTFTRRAFETSWRDMWEDNLDTNRQHVLMLITDGVPPRAKIHVLLLKVHMPQRVSK